MSIFSGLISGSSATIGGNVGIGTTNPANLFHVNGSNYFARISNTGVADGGLKISYQNSDTHGLHLTYNPQSAVSYIDNTYPTASGQVYGDIYFRQNVGGNMTTRMTIKADGGGNVGIGTTNPGYKLDLIGRARLRSDGVSSAGHWLTDNTGTTDVFTGLLGVSSTDTWGVYSAGSWRLVVSNGGNVGIGTTSPAAKLDVRGDVYTTTTWWGYPTELVGRLTRGGSGLADLQIVQPNGGFRVINSAYNSALFVVNDIGTFYSSGSATIATNIGTGEAYLGVGEGRNASGYAYVDLVGDTTYPDYGTRLIRGNTGANATSFLSHRGTGELGIFTQEAAPITFYTSATEQVRINSSGNVGIGTTNPGTKLTVNGATTITGSSTIIGSLLVGQNSNSSTAARIDLTAGGNGFDSVIDFGYYDTFDANIWNVGRKGSTGAFFISNYGSGLEVNVVTINTSNNVGIGTTSPSNKLHIQGNVSASSYTSSIAGAVGFVGTASYAVNAANGVTINSNVDNYLVTATGTTGTLQGESTVTLDGTTFTANTTNFVVNSTNITVGNDTTDIVGIGNNTVYVNNSKVGIGTTGLTGRLTLDTVTLAGIDIFRSDTNANFSAIRFRDTTNANNNAIIGWNANELRMEGTSTVTLHSNSSERIRIDSSGNVGIGTTSVTAGYRLHVSGSVLSNVSSGNTSFVASTNNANAALNAIAGVGLDLNTDSTNRNLRFSSNSSPLMFISGSGNVGIGTTSPSYKLDIAVNVAAASTPSTTLRLNNTSDAGHRILFSNSVAATLAAIDADIESTGAGTDDSILKFWTATNGSMTEKMRIDKSGNVGIGTISPATKLDVNGSIAIGGYTRMSGSATYTMLWRPDGGVAMYLGGSDAGNYYDNSGHYFRDRSSNTTMFINAVTGNVGIGTTSNFDGSKLDVRSGKIVAGTNTSTNGSVTIQNYYTDGALSLWGSMYSSGGPLMGYGVKSSTTTANSFLSATGINISRGAYIIEGNVHRWYNGATQTVAIDSAVTMTERMTMDANGNVGIGTTSPATRLHVQGTSTAGSAVEAFRLTNPDTGYTLNSGVKMSFYYGGTAKNLAEISALLPVGGDGNFGDLLFSTRTSDAAGVVEKVRIKANGNVGIGTTSPANTLHVQGNVSASSYTSSINNAVGFLGTASRAVIMEKIDVLSGGSTTGLGIYSGSFSGSFTGLGPGTVNNIALFNASRTVSSSVIVQSSNNIGIGISPSYKLEVSGSQRVSGGSLGVNVNPNATLGRIDAGNDIVAYSSDKRLKTNIEVIHHSIDKVLSLNGFTFNWNDTAHRLAGYDTASKQVGVYAQEVQSILPEAVKLAPFDNDGTDRSTSGENYLTVQYEKLVPLLIEAIKELKAEVDELKRRLE